jgi:hypothetical protein
MTVSQSVTGKLARIIQICAVRSKQPDYHRHA